MCWSNSPVYFIWCNILVINIGTAVFCMEMYKSAPSNFQYRHMVSNFIKVHTIVQRQKSVRETQHSLHEFVSCGHTKNVQDVNTFVSLPQATGLLALPLLQHSKGNTDRIKHSTTKWMPLQEAWAVTLSKFYHLPFPGTKRHV